MTRAPSDDEPTAESVERVRSERILDRTTLTEDGKIVNAELDGDEVVFTVEVPVGECPACGTESFGTTAWNSAHDREFVCGNGACGVERFKDPAGRDDA